MDLNIDIDIRAELEEFEWKNDTWKEDKLIACSPFRYEEHPSFYCFFDTGVWGDSGAVGEYEKGSFLSLLSFLREETEEDTIEYLHEKYGYGDSSKFFLKRLNLKPSQIKRKALSSDLIDGLTTSDYLERRGISKGIQDVLNIGYDKQREAVAIPWFLPNGELGNIKYRKTNSKRFFYAKGGLSISKMLYGINILYEKPYLKHAVITEAEIDAISCMVVGYPAIAAGGSKWSRAKTDLLIRSNLESITIATDNDEVGQELKEQIIEELGSRFNIRILEFDENFKDCNEVLMKDRNMLKKLIEKARKKNRFRFN